MFALLLAPFVVLVALGVWKAPLRRPPTRLPSRDRSQLAASRSSKPQSPPPPSPRAVSVTLWNYMGWDNASTVAQEVEDPAAQLPPRHAHLRRPRRRSPTSSRSLAVGSRRCPCRPLLHRRLGRRRPHPRRSRRFGTVLALAVVLGGTLNGAGMFNALMLSYARVPYALAQDGLLPRFLARTTGATQLARPSPGPRVLVCAVAWALALRLSFERLISIDLVLYGASLLLEFVALVVLRVREPAPRRVPSASPEASPQPSSPASAPPSSSPSPSTPRATSTSARSPPSSSPLWSQWPARLPTSPRASAYRARPSPVRPHWTNQLSFGRFG